MVKLWLKNYFSNWLQENVLLLQIIFVTKNELKSIKMQEFQIKSLNFKKMLAKSIHILYILIY